MEMTRRDFRWILGGFLCLALLGSFNSNSAAGLFGPSFNISSGQAAELFQGTSTSGANNPITRQFLVVWADRRNLTTTGVDVYGRLVNADGSLGLEFPISEAAGDQLFPRVVYASLANRFLVVWMDTRTCSASQCSDLYGQFVDRLGRRDGSEFVVSAAAGDQRYHDVVYNSVEDQFLVVWEDNRRAAFDVYGRVLRRDGGTLTGDFPITRVGSSGGGLPKRTLAFDPGKNQYLVSWSCYRASPPWASSCFRLVGADGTLWGDEVSDMYLPSGSAVAFSPISDRFLAAGGERERVGAILFASRRGDLSPEVTRLVESFRISDSGIIARVGTAAHYPPTDLFLVVWQDGRNADSCWDGGENCEIYGQLVRPDGILVGTNFGIGIGGSRAPIVFPDLVYAPDVDRFLVTWVDGRAGCCGVVGQLVSAKGGYTPPGNRMTVSPDHGTTVTFPRVSVAGETTANTGNTGPTPPSGFWLGEPTTYYSIRTTTTFMGPVRVCVTYDPTHYSNQASDFRLLQFIGDTWVDVTISNDSRNHIACGDADVLGVFAVGELPWITLTPLDPTATEDPTHAGRFRVNRTGPTTAPLTVSFSRVGTATAGSDYADFPLSLTIAVGAAFADIALTPLDDSLAEQPETVALILTPGATYRIGTPGGATLTITSDEPLPWRSLGPYDGFVHALAIDARTPATMYAGTWGGGVFKRVDGETHWNAVNDGLTSGRIRALAVHPTNPGTLYAGTLGGVFKSTDGGGHWSAVNGGLTDLDVLALAIDPGTPATLYAGTWGGGVFKSTVGGGGWQAANAGVANLFVHSLAIDPKSPGTIYAGTWGGGVYKSSTGGF